jgi:hypothetical protein
MAGEKFQRGTVAALSLSVVSSVSIVICNKAHECPQIHRRYEV